MAWPLSQDYNEALQNPQTSFNDAELRRGQVVVNALGIPQPCSGNFADVYAVECPASKTKWAVKCFTREVHGLRERYSEISKYLQQARLPFTVDFQYLEQGIRIAGRWYPILKMHWVEGFTLNAFVRRYADKPAMLESLLQIWVRMAARLQESGIAHADLQHGNVLLVSGSTTSSLAVKLIDYDGMFVPALVGGDSGEVGHPCYQHPQRLAERTYSLEVDRFPLLLVATALNCIKVGGRALWEKYDSGDNLLFREADLRAPSKSPLFYELLKLGDSRASRLACQTLDALKGRLESVPLLEEVLPELRAPPAPKPATALPTPKRTIVLERGAGNLPDWIDFAPPPPKRTIVKAAAVQPAAEGVEAGSAWDFEGEDTSRSRRRKGGRLRWMWGVAALVLVGGIFALALRNEPEKLKDLAVTPPPPSPVPPKSQGADNPPAAMDDYDRTGGYRFVHFGKGGSRVVLAFFDPTQKQHFARVYDLASGQALTPPLKHEGSVVHASFSPDGRRVVTASHDETARLWDAATGKELKKVTMTVPPQP